MDKSIGSIFYRRANCIILNKHEEVLHNPGKKKQFQLEGHLAKNTHRLWKRVQLIIYDHKDTKKEYKNIKKHSLRL